MVGPSAFDFRNARGGNRTLGHEERLRLRLGDGRKFRHVLLALRRGRSPSGDVDAGDRNLLAGNDGGFRTGIVRTVDRKILIANLDDGENRAAILRFDDRRP